LLDLDKRAVSALKDYLFHLIFLIGTVYLENLELFPPFERMGEYRDSKKLPIKVKKKQIRK
jgi:hypothetical protein